MDAYKILEIKKSVFENNDLQAEILRSELKKERVFLLNLMSSPGSGKTSVLLKTIEALKKEMLIGILEADIDSDVDAKTISTTGAKVIQLHTGGMCHLDAEMTRQGLDGLNMKGIDLVVLENIGNLICTADYDTGASKKAMILSVPEGDDKPLKYPHMFSIVDALIINKIDTLDYFDFDIQAVTQRIRSLNPQVKIFPVSAKTCQGIDDWANWIRQEVKEWKE